MRSQFLRMECVPVSPSEAQTDTFSKGNWLFMFLCTLGLSALCPYTQLRMPPAGERPQHLDLEAILILEKFFLSRACENLAADSDLSRARMCLCVPPKSPLSS